MDSYKNNIPENNASEAAHETLLWRFIDGEASVAEKEEIEKLMTSNVYWKNKYAEFLQLHQLLHTTETDEPSIRFTKNVMEQVAQYRIAPTASSYVNKYVCLFIGGLLFSLIVVCLVIITQNTNWQNTTNKQSIVNMQDLSQILLTSNHLYLWIAANVILAFYVISKRMANKRKHSLVA